jgi:hypothetical protein
LVYEPDDDDPNVQIVPVHDAVLVHDREGFDCLCGPRVDFTEATPIVIHHSLEGREQYEAR